MTIQERDELMKLPVAWPGSTLRVRNWSLGDLICDRCGGKVAGMVQCSAVAGGLSRFCPNGCTPSGAVDTAPPWEAPLTVKRGTSGDERFQAEFLQLETGIEILRRDIDAKSGDTRLLSDLAAIEKSVAAVREFKGF